MTAALDNRRLLSPAAVEAIAVGFPPRWVDAATNPPRPFRSGSFVGTVAGSFCELAREDGVLIYRPHTKLKSRTLVQAIVTLTLMCGLAGFMLGMFEMYAALALYVAVAIAFAAVRANAFLRSLAAATCFVLTTCTSNCHAVRSRSTAGTYSRCSCCSSRSLACSATTAARCSCHCSPFTTTKRAGRSCDIASRAAKLRHWVAGCTPKHATSPPSSTCHSSAKPAPAATTSKATQRTPRRTTRSRESPGRDRLRCRPPCQTLPPPHPPLRHQPRRSPTRSLG